MWASNKGREWQELDDPAAGKGRCQITMKLDSGRKPSVLTGFPAARQGLEILNAVQEIRASIEKGNSIQEANEEAASGPWARRAAKLRRSESSIGSPRPTTSSSHGRTPGRDPRRPTDQSRRFKLTLKTRPTPNDGPSLMRAFAKLFFDEIYPAGPQKGRTTKTAARQRWPPSKLARRGPDLRHGIEEMGRPKDGNRYRQRR